MAGFGLLLLVLAGIAFFWKRQDPVLLPGTKTTSIKPAVAIGLLVLGLLCLAAGGGSDTKQPPAKAPPAAAKK